MKPVQIPALIRKWNSSLTWSRESSESIYLTFDDGPHPDITPWVLGELDKVGAKATFFCLGENLSTNQKVAKSLIESGHRLGNHTFTHLNGWKSSTKKYSDEVIKTESCLEELGLIKNKLFRPPYGRIRKSQIRALKDQFEIVMWSHLSWDFKSNLNCDKIIKKLKKVQPGSILLFHDSPKAFSNLKKILPELLEFYTEKGFKFETL